MERTIKARGVAWASHHTVVSRAFYTGEGHSIGKAHGRFFCYVPPHWRNGRYVEDPIAGRVRPRRDGTFRLRFLFTPYCVTPWKSVHDQAPCTADLGVSQIG